VSCLILRILNLRKPSSPRKKSSDGP